MSQTITLESADALANDKRYPEAIEAYKAYLLDHPTSSSAHRGLGNALLATGDKDSALAECKKAAALNPTDSESRYSLGYILGAQKRYEEALPELDAAYQLQPHNPSARQGLMFCLVTIAKQVASSDPSRATTLLERAWNLDRTNTDLVGQFLSHLVTVQDNHKAQQVIASLDAAQLQNPSVQPWVAKVTGGASPQATNAAVAPAKQIPCPQCKLPISDFAAICPHCNFRLRETGTFAGRDRGPNYVWQDIVLTILSVIWAIVGLLGLYSGFRTNSPGTMLISIIQVIIGGGLALRMEWIALIAKIFCYVNLFYSGYFMLVMFAVKQPIVGTFLLVHLCMTGLLIYLINYHFD